MAGFRPTGSGPTGAWQSNLPWTGTNSWPVASIAVASLPQYVFGPWSPQLIAWSSPRVYWRVSYSIRNAKLPWAPKRIVRRIQAFPRPRRGASPYVVFQAVSPTIPALPSPIVAQRRRFFIQSYHGWHKRWHPPHHKISFVDTTNRMAARVTWVGVEVVHSGNSVARVTWSAVEVVRSILDAPQPAKPFPPPRHPIYLRRRRVIPHHRHAPAALGRRRPVVFVTA